MSVREIKRVTWTAESLGDLPTDQAALVAWLKQRAMEDDLTYALIHADDGVIWGKFEDGRWLWSSDAFPDISPTPNVVTLQQARLFGLKAEVFLWRDAGALKGRVIRDDWSGDQECFDEPQLLWGKPDGEAQQGFQLMREGAQGLRHAPPIALGLRQDVDQSLGDRRRACLRVRHYLAQEDAARIAASRLVSLEMCEEEK